MGAVMAVVAVGLVGMTACGSNKSHASAAGTTTASVQNTVHISGNFEVTSVVEGAPGTCHGKICTIRTSGTGTLSPYGKATFTAVVIADASQASCGVSSQRINRLTRELKTDKGTLVLHGAGRECVPQGGGPRVDVSWVLDGADSTGTFAGARGSGTDVAYPDNYTDAVRGTITLAR